MTATRRWPNAVHRLFGIDTPVADDRTPPVPDLRKAAGQVWAHVQAELWDRSYFLHVADCYTEADRHLLTPTIPETPHRARRPSGRIPAPTRHRTRTALAPTTDTRLPQPATAAATTDQSRFAARRTGISAPSDHDILLPYSDLDTPEPTLMHRPQVGSVSADRSSS